LYLHFIRIELNVYIENLEGNGKKGTDFFVPSTISNATTSDTTSRLALLKEQETD
jgi:hypothetical protein